MERLKHPVTYKMENLSVEIQTTRATMKRLKHPVTYKMENLSVEIQTTRATMERLKHPVTYKMENLSVEIQTTRASMERFKLPVTYKMENLSVEIQTTRERNHPGKKERRTEGLHGCQPGKLRPAKRAANRLKSHPVTEAGRPRGTRALISGDQERKNYALNGMHFAQTELE
jgi:hypothetical protein